MKLSSSLVCAAAVLALHTTAPAQFVLGEDAELGMDDGEITPDGRYGVIRMNGHGGALRVYEMATGQRVEAHECGPTLSGPNQDGVAVTNERCIVIGNCALIGDLGAVGTPAFLLGRHDVGRWARDVAITPNGRIAAVRGGFDQGASIGGLFLFDLEDGTLIATAPGIPADPYAATYSWDLDTVVATDTHAVFLSLGSSSSPTTRVTVFGLRLGDGAVTSVVYETSAASGPDQDMLGAPSDLALLHDGRYVTVRSENEVALFTLSGRQTAPAWRKVPQGDPGPLGNATMDTLAVTSNRIATITRWSNGGVGAQLDLFDLAGNQVSDRTVGDPHDLAVTPSGRRLVVRTSSGANLYDMTTDPTAGSLLPLDTMSASALYTGWAAGLDSVEVTDTRAVMVFRGANANKVKVHDIGQDTFVPVGAFTSPEVITDLALTPNGTRAVISADSSLQVFDLRSNTLTLEHDVSPWSGPFPWSDGVVADDDRALVWGVDGSQDGWVAIVDLFSQPAEFCEPGPNSTGVAAGSHAAGSASVAANDLTLWATDLPQSQVTMFLYASGKLHASFGDRLTCMAGTVHKFPATSSGTGTVQQVVDVTGPANLGGAITAGSTWHFQAAYQDGARRNITPGLAIDFVP